MHYLVDTVGPSDTAMPIIPPSFVEKEDLLRTALCAHFVIRSTTHCLRQLYTPY